MPSNILRRGGDHHHHNNSNDNDKKNKKNRKNKKALDEIYKIHFFCIAQASIFQQKIVEILEKVPSGPVRKSRKKCFSNFFFREILTSEYFWVPVSFSYGYHPLLFVHGQNFLPSAKGQKTILRE